jgi:hypothetical protein
LIDDFDRLTQRWLSDVYHKAVIFIDNAGSDFILGALPLARWLARRGTHVVLAANERPTLNDMTIAELRDWWPEITRTEPTFGELPITSVSSGTGEPLIDLSEVSSELNAASEDADLVILEGMGRGVESNLGASFTCDALNIAMLKDHSVAKRHGGKLFDVVCRFRQPMPSSNLVTPIVCKSMDDRRLQHILPASGKAVRYIDPRVSRPIVARGGLKLSGQNHARGIQRTQNRLAGRCRRRPASTCRRTPR